VSRAGYYRWLGREAPGEEDMGVRAALQQIVLEHRRRYGYRRVTAELRRRGLAVNHKRVARLMREDNLLGLQPKAWTRTTDAEHEHPVYLNVAARMNLSGINQLWIADITYIRLKTEFVYLAVVLDAFSRRVIGWALQRRMSAQLTVAALEQAIAARQPAPGLVHHSDRGIQYACREYVAVLEAHGMVASMSRPANPYDNASCESFMRTEQTAQASAPANTCGAASMSFFRHGEIYPPDGQTQTGSEPTSPLPALIGTDESPAGYSLAGCSPAEPASTSPAGYDRQPEVIEPNSIYSKRQSVSEPTVSQKGFTPNPGITLGPNVSHTGETNSRICPRFRVIQLTCGHRLRAIG
jgi:transposase InsO family protein